MASPALSVVEGDSVRAAGALPEVEAVRALFRQQMARNVRFWTEQIAAHQSNPSRLLRERDNVLKALVRALQEPAPSEGVIDLLLAFHPYMETQGAIVGWERLVEAGLKMCQRLGRRADEAALLDRLGELRRDRGEWTQAAACHEQACRRLSAVGDRRRAARALANLAQVYWLQRRYDEAMQTLAEALGICQTCEDAEGQAFARTQLGLVHFERLQHDQALVQHEIAYDLWSRLGNREGMARSQHNLANACRGLGRWSEAEAHFQAALALYDEMDSRLYLALAAMDMGNLYLEQGQPGRAEALYRKAKDAMERIHYTRGLAQVYNNLGMACAQQLDWGLAEDCFLRSVGLWRQLGEPVGQANAEDNLADALVQQGKWQPALEWLTAAQELLRGLDATGRVAALISDIRLHLEQANAIRLGACAS